MAAGQTFVGTVMPKRTSTVSSSVEGRVIELKVREGDQVKQGDTLAQLRIEQLQIELAAASALLTLREYQLSETKQSLPEEIKQADARAQAAEALMTFARSKLKRAESLFGTRAISEDELQEAKSVALAAEKKHEENKLAYKLAVAIEPVKIKQVEAQVNAQEEEVRRLQDELAEHTIAAPFDGYVTKEHTEVGQWISKGDPIVEVIEVDEVDIEVPVLESYLPQFQVGMTARVTIGALPKQWWEAPVSAIVPQADVRSRSFPVKVRLKNSSGPGGVLFKSGMFARVTLPIGGKGPAKLVPKDAVVLGGPSPIVYAVAPLAKSPASQGPPSVGPAPDGVARQVPVQLGAAIDGWIEVRGPLQPGELVATEGNERLFPGQPLIVVNRDQLPRKKSTTKPSK